MRNNAAVEHLCVRLSDLLGNDISRLRRIVHEDGGVDVAQSARMLALEVELSQNWRLWIKATNSVEHLSTHITQLSKVFVELNSESVGNCSFN